MRKTVALIVTLVLMAAMPAFALEDSQADQPVPQRYRGRMAAMSGPAAGATAFLVFHVDRFATDAEVQVLGQTLSERGEEALLKAVSDTDVAGWIKVGNGLRYNLRNQSFLKLSWNRWELDSGGNSDELTLESYRLEYGWSF